MAPVGWNATHYLSLLLEELHHKSSKVETGLPANGSRSLGSPTIYWWRQEPDLPAVKVLLVLGCCAATQGKGGTVRGRLSCAELNIGYI